jgi:hypothetical protein
MSQGFSGEQCGPLASCLCIQVNVEIVGQSSASQTTEFSSVVDGSVWSSDGVQPVPETVTVTLTQKPGDGRFWEYR